MPDPKTFSVVFNLRNEIEAVVTPDGTRHSWDKVSRELVADPQSVNGITVPLEIVTTTTGLT